MYQRRKHAGRGWWDYIVGGERRCFNERYEVSWSREYGRLEIWKILKKKRRNSKNTSQPEDTAVQFWKRILWATVVLCPYPRPTSQAGVPNWEFRRSPASLSQKGSVSTSKETEQAVYSEQLGQAEAKIVSSASKECCRLVTK